jgi:hypothetical protein
VYEAILNIFKNVVRRWDEAGKDPDQFPDICFEELTANVDFTHDDLLDLVSNRALPLQSYPKDEFGEVPFTICRNDDVFIDIYVWNQHHTSVHDHHFMGAFKILQGRSYQLSYEFKTSQKINDGLFLGKLSVVNKTTLKTGDRQRIHFYEDFIHQNLHLENPTVTLLIRTNQAEKILNSYYTNSKYTHLRPTQLHTKLIESMIFFYKTKNPRAKEYFFQILDNKDEIFKATLFTNLVGIVSFKLKQEIAKQLAQDVKEYVFQHQKEKWPMQLVEDHDKSLLLMRKLFLFRTS